MYSSGYHNAMSTPDLNKNGEYNQRLHTSPIPPPPAPLDLPEPTSPRFIPQSNASRSPLRNSITIDPITGTISQDGSPNPIDENDPWGRRDHQMTHSPTPSITKFASSFVQRVGSLVSSVSPSSESIPLPTDAEIEAEAASQRDRSRQEAERILTQEAMERKRVEERVMEMLESSRTKPTRSQTTPLPDTPSPSTREGGTTWWTAAKNRLTKDKELTPAQQVIAEAKAKEKEKRKSKDYKDWPANGTSKYPEPYPQPSLSLPPGARPPGGFVGSGANVIPSSASMSSAPIPQQPSNATPRTPSPSRSIAMHHNNRSSTDLSHHPGTSPAFSTTSSNQETTPVYAQFTSQGSLDVSATLLNIARRFEKLERWAVGHVRALEERMNDVEQWLVDKERERERERQGRKNSAISNSAVAADPGASSAAKLVREVTIERVEVDHEVKREVGEMKDELGELRSRVGELGREMARLATTSTNSSRPETPSEAGFGIGRLGSPGMTGSNPTTPIVSGPRALPSIPAHRDRAQSPSHSIAHSETASIISTTSTMTRTKLPYPTGDYTSPSPSGSPPPRQITATPTGGTAGPGFSRSRPISYSSRPMSPPQNPMTEIGRSPAQNAVASPSGSPSVGASTKPIGTSPNPRKRYTVALGQPLSSSPNVSYSTEEAENKESMFDEDLFSEPPKVELQTAFFNDVKAGNYEKGDDQDVDGATIKKEASEEGTESGAVLSRRDTIGKTPINLSSLSTSPPPSQTSSPNRNPGLQRGSPRVSPNSRRIRTQSTYGVPGSSPSSVLNGPKVGVADNAPSTPSRNVQTKIDPNGSLRSRSKSIDRFGDIGAEPGNTFVDPLVIRKKEKVTVGSRNSMVGSPVTRGRVPFGDLLAFFDAEKQPRSAAP